MIYQATFQTRSKQLGSALSKDLQKKYGKKSTRIIEGDSITILRGEFKGVTGKITKISTEKTSVTIDGVKKEKTKGDKFDVYIHTSNLVVTALNTSDKWRITKRKMRNNGKYCR
jgi:large subunit ribosomal protein L24